MFLTYSSLESTHRSDLDLRFPPLRHREFTEIGPRLVPVMVAEWAADVAVDDEIAEMR